MIDKLYPQKMQTTNDPNKQVLLSVLKQTKWAKINSAKQMKKSTIITHKIIAQSLLSKPISQILQLKREWQRNYDIVAKFCLQEIANKKLEAEQDYSQDLFFIEQVEVPNNQGNFLSRIKSKNIQNLHYMHLKADKHIYMFNYAFIPQIKTQLKFAGIMSYVQLCIKQNKLIRSIMPFKLWQRAKPLYKLIFGQKVFQLANEQNILLFPDEKAGSFDFQSSSMIFSRNMWYYDSYNLFITIKGSRYLIKGHGIFEEQIAYTAWRKDVIDQPQYCRVIDKTLINSSIWGLKRQFNTLKIENQCTPSQNKKFQIYKNFHQCNIFHVIPQELIQQIFRSGQVVQYSKNQIIYKSLSTLDMFYIIIDGQIIIRSEQNQDKIIKKSEYFNLISLVKQISSEKVTLQVNSHSVFIFTISLWKLKYILGHFMQQIFEIVSFPLQTAFQSKLGIYLQLSEFEQKMIKTDQIKSKGLSSNTTRQLSLQNIKISKQLWENLCKNNLKILFCTIEISSKIQE